MALSSTLSTAQNHTALGVFGVSLYLFLSFTLLFLPPFFVTAGFTRPPGRARKKIGRLFNCIYICSLGPGGNGFQKALARKGRW